MKKIHLWLSGLEHPQRDAAKVRQIMRRRFKKLKRSVGLPQVNKNICWRMRKMVTTGRHWILMPDNGGYRYIRTNGAGMKSHLVKMSDEAMRSYTSYLQSYGDLTGNETFMRPLDAPNPNEYPEH